MNTSINLDEYLSEEEKKQICVDVFSDMARAQIMKAPERIFSNAAYHVVFQMVDDAIDGDTRQIIRDKAVEIIGNLSEHTVFRKSDAWHNEQSKAYTYLNQAVHDNKAVLESAVVERLGSFDGSVMRESVKDAIQDIVNDRLFGQTDE